MAKTIDLRTYVLLERAFVRRLQRSWRIQSAPTYAAITKACIDHKWDEARRLVGDLDMTEVGTENREWITYMLLSCAAFGAGTVAKGKPSFVGVGKFDTFLKQVTSNILQYLEHGATAQVQAEALQSIAEDEAKTKALPKVAREYVRDEKGQFAESSAGQLAEMGRQLRQAVQENPRRLFDPLWQNKGEASLETLLTSQGPITNPKRRGEGLPDEYGMASAHSHGDDPQPMNHEDVRLWLQNEVKPSKGRITRLVTYHNDGTMEVLEITPNTKPSGLKPPKGDDFWQRDLAGGYSPESMRAGVAAWAKKHGLSFHVVRWGEAVKWDEVKHPRDEKGQFSAYHGSNVAGITELASTYGAVTAWFSEHPNLAKEYAKAKTSFLGGTATVYEAKLTIQKPLMIKGDMNAKTTYREERERTGLEFTVGKYGDEVVEGVEQKFTRYQIITSPEFVEAARAKGYDGLRVNEGGHITWGVFSPKQVTLKWEETKHPRDKAGQFTVAGAFQITDEQTVGDRPEGAGPAYDEYQRLYKATLETSQAFSDAKDAHRVNVERAEKQFDEVVKEHPEEDLSQLEARVWGAPEYVRTRDIARAAQKVFDETIDAYTRQQVVMKTEIVTNLATKVAKDLGMDPSIIHVVDKTPPEFSVGNRKFKEAGHFDPRDGQIEINVRNIAYDDAPQVKGIAAHELSHVMYQALNETMKAEYDRFHDKAGYDESHTPWFHEHFTQQHMYGHAQAKPERLADVEREFPALAVASIISGYYPSMGVSDEMKQENGHSAYAKSYWAPAAVQARGTYDTAVNETTAEVTRYLTNPQSWNEKEKPDPDSPWVAFAQEMHEWYKWKYEQVRESSRYHPPDAKGRKYGEPGYNT